MNSFEPIEIGLIAAVIIATICFILLLAALKSKNNMKHKASGECNLKEQQLKSSHEEVLEEERIENKKQVTKRKEEFEVTVNGKEREIDALKLLSKNKSEYMTDMRLIGIGDRLVKEKHIRCEDMHIMANTFLPSNEFNNIQHISHLVLTRAGLYIIDSQLLRGHVYNGISGARFQELPMLKQVFDTLDLNTQAPQTLVPDQHEDNHSKLSFINYSDQLSTIENLATDSQTELGLKYKPISTLYLDPKHDKDVTISNYAQSLSVKVLVGPEQLDEFFNKFVFHGRIQYNVDELQNIMDKIESFN